MGLEVGHISGTRVQSQVRIPLKSANENQSAIRNQRKNQPQEKVKRADLDKALGQINQRVLPHNMVMHYVHHDKLDIYYVQVVDTVTKKVIREIPPKKFLDMCASALERFGLLVDEKV